MNLKCFFVCFQIVAFTLLAEDAAQPTIKKEKMPSLPHVWFSEGLVCLKAKESGVAVANQAQDIDTTMNFVNASLIQPKFEWNNGLQINVGYQPQDWFLFATWTYIQNKAKGQSSTDGFSGFFPILSLSTTNEPSTYVTSSSVSWRLNTNMGDLGTIFSWNPVKCFILKSIIGLRFASLNQKIKANYGGGEFNEGIDAISMRNNFFGIGPLVGLSPVIVLPKGLSLVGNIGTSGLLGGFWVRQNESYLTQSLFHTHRSMTRFRWMLDARAALAWQTEFLYKALVFCVQAGWEWHKFFHQNEWQYNQFIGDHKSRNIVLQGGFISICLGF
ncbi:MAG: hypothetical protein KBC64_01530 [Simkaniaceae bacterium]|nr:hypothetical protein [Simkaniaceae bacterium]